MSYFVVGMGGSGARATEALLYLCAAGLGPDELRLVFVDSDRANDAWRRVGELVTAYGEIRGLVQLIQKRASRLFHTAVQIQRADGGALVWDPLATTTVGPHNQLNRLFAGLAQGEHAQGEQLVYQALYSPAQRAANLTIGLIGAAVLAKCFDPGQAPWNRVIPQIRQAVANAQSVWFFLLGSLFGGTGATGMRLIPRMVHESLVNRMAGANPNQAALNQAVAAIQAQVRWGAAFLLPYFTFTRPADPDQCGIGPDPATFTLRAQQAIEYFNQFARAPQFNRVYALGVQTPVTQANFSLGGQQQSNTPHVVELLAAGAALDFQNCPTAVNDQIVNELRLVARGDPQNDPKTNQPVDRFEWQDVPPIDGRSVQEWLGRLADAAYAYLKLFYPALEEVRAGKRVGERTPWYVDLLTSRGVAPAAQGARAKLDAMKDFSLAFFAWLRGLHHGAAGMRVELANIQAFPDDKPAGWPEPQGRGRTTLLLETNRKGLSLDAVWKLMCDQSPGRPKPGLAGLGDFFEALFSLGR